MQTNALNLALWIRERYPYADALSHLKLQKLGFYAYGATLAFDRDDEIGRVVFEPWEHGPVNREVWDEYRGFGAATIPAPKDRSVSYSSRTESVLSDALDVYGVLSPWAIRNQSHLEAPWRDAHRTRRVRIDHAQMSEHFRAKLRSGPVALPEYVLDSGSFSLDGIPTLSFDSFHAAANAVRGFKTAEARRLLAD
jgi:uncharacterized phage-associated protein